MIRGKQWRSEAIRGNQWRSEAIRGQSQGNHTCRSASKSARSPGRCTFTATRVPSAVVARCTCPMIDGHQRSSEVIKGHQRPSEAIRGNQRSSEVIRGHQRSSEVIKGHQKPSKAISRQRLSQAIRGTQEALKRYSEVIRGHQRSSPGRGSPLRSASFRSSRTCLRPPRPPPSGTPVDRRREAQRPAAARGP